MDEKIYELLELMYIDVQQVKKEMNSMKEDIQVIKDTMATKEDLEQVREELKCEIETVYEEVKGLREDLTITEIITTKNAHDIAILKAAR